MDVFGFLSSFCYILLIALSYLVVSKRHFWQLARQFKGPPARPLIGNILELQGNESHTFSILVDTIKEYGNVFRIWIGYKLIIVINDPTDIQQILGNSKISNRDRMVTKAIEPFVGSSLLTARGDKWKVHRKIVTPIFHFTVLQTYVAIFARQSRVLCDKLEEFPNGRVVDIHKYVSMCTMASICETAIGLSMDVQSGSGKEFYSGIIRAGELVHSRVVRPYLMHDWLYPFTRDGAEAERTKKHIFGFTDKIIEKKLEEYNKTKSFAKDDESNENAGGKKIKTLLEMLVESSQSAGSAMTVSEIRDELTTIAAVGFDTSAISISNLFLLLGLNLEIQEEISRELDETFGSDSRSATMEDLNRMCCLERAIKETLRLLPAIPIIAREINEDVALPSGLVVPAGCSVVAFSYMVHRDPRYFPDPERFVPDRWLPDPEGTTARHPYAYLPFSAGSRNCIGQKYAMLQMKSIASSVLRRFTVRHRFKEEDLKCLDLSSAMRFSKLYEIQLTKK